MTITTLVTFYTKGQPFDQGEDLSSLVQNIKSKYQKNFDYFIALNPSLLEKEDPAWKKILFNEKLVKDHLSSRQKKGINNSWVNLNCMLWKPALLSSILSKDSGIEEDSIIIFHDSNLDKYPIYKKNFEEISSFFKCKLTNHSIAIISDDLFPLYSDCKQELLNEYLNSEGLSLCHRWSGCIAFKKNNFSREFCKHWYNLTLEDKNRSQTTDFVSYPNFLWHSPEQSTLSVIYYLWKYCLKRRNHIKTLFTKDFRYITKKLTLFDEIKFLIRSIKFYLRSFKSFIPERIKIIYLANKNLERLDFGNVKPPYLKIKKGYKVKK